MPQVFVRFTGKDPVEITAGGDESISSVVTRAYALVFPSAGTPNVSEFEVSYEGKMISRLHMSLSIGDHNIKAYKTILVKQTSERVMVRDASVLDRFREFVRVSAGELGDGEVTFISVACFDCNHGDASIRSQQCPDQLLHFCMDNRLDLNIILIDPLFADKSLDYPQIYSQPEWRLLSTENEGKVRQYTYTPAVSRQACDVWLTVFAAGIREFGTEISGQGKVIDGISIPDLFTLLEKPTITRSCLICGCFAFSEINKGQYFTRGPKRVVEGTGFPFNA